MKLQQVPLLAHIHKPEYTGENRCLPCTIVNLVIAGILAVAAAVVSPLLAIVVVALSVTAIALRGYLVPGTPSLTKRYFPDWLLAKFDKEPEPGAGTLVAEDGSTTSAGATTTPSDTDADTGSGAEPGHTAGEPLNPERWLLEYDLVVPCSRTGGDGEGAEASEGAEGAEGAEGVEGAKNAEDGEADDLCLTEELENTWRVAIDERRDGDRVTQVGTFFDVDQSAVTVEQADGPDQPVRALIEGRLAAQWESDAALLADLGSMHVLAERVPEWPALSLEQRSQLANGLRAFVEECPSCTGEISLDEETVESCCRSYQVYAITCNDCESRLLEVRQ
ncbi:uncharacterized protein Nmag_1828 [Natrialba magadii ATCC 43099]|uniref:Uncharacterized protein n=1 Tax=Natrialba magadii (strain ATCC 43099 / DSM 3394 / CCM 3739 / CIP 104546 / IAM 13178 / JCM 8861 / NBRC 102185 / NCIMB 2190 / MS3) TaxID=547559 RepID=D3SUZ4_NATMM|nr:hypothetical protein [Natrialba magadii]ADD05402.1 uncharacterized protein Nmag_1828 [Natrialba magadii ATCC 43099]ELY29284.1 hypothetical protein C500_11220 [Natrialba magadii ATCC 43099]